MHHVIDLDLFEGDLHVFLTELTRIVNLACKDPLRMVNIRPDCGPLLPIFFFLIDQIRSELGFDH